MNMRSQAMLVAALMLGTLTFAERAAAQDWPAQPLTMVVPFAAGGPTDVLGRILAAQLSEVLGKPVVVKNVAGAGGMAGSNSVAQASPDGYVFVLGSLGTSLYKAWQLSWFQHDGHKIFSSCPRSRAVCCYRANVRPSPIASQMLRRRECSDVPLATNAPQQTASLFDNLIGRGQNLRAKVQAKCLAGFRFDQRELFLLL